MTTPTSGPPTRRLRAVVCKTCGHAARTDAVPERCPECQADIGGFGAPVRLVYAVESLEPPRPHTWLETETRGTLPRLS